MKPRNLVICGTEEKLALLEEEYRSIGFNVKRTSESLTVFTRPRKRVDEKRRKRGFAKRGNSKSRKS
jgi:hypothetical protein